MLKKNKKNAVFKNTEDSSALIILSAVVITSVYLQPEQNEEKLSNNSQSLNNLLQHEWPLRDEDFEAEQLSDLNKQNNALEFGFKNLQLKESIESHLPQVPLDSPAHKSQLASYTSTEAQEISKLGYILNLGTRDLNQCSAYEKMNSKCRKPKRWKFYQPLDMPSQLCNIRKEEACSLSLYRSINGSCNHMKNKNWGAALTNFRRILLPLYEDGISQPRKATDGSQLPSAREISLKIHRPYYRNDIQFTVMLAVWGQFIDHDITATALSKGKNGTSISCCQKQNEHPECFPVYVGKDDPFYQDYNKTCMEFVRSAPAPFCGFGPRENINQVTSFLDGSVVYGANEADTKKLRAFKNGELKMLNTNLGELLPVSEDPADGCNREEELKRGRYCFLSGDARGNENLLLTSMHLIWARHHNAIARVLKKINPRWTDETLFQESRKIVGAQIQHITYTEFLPSVLPRKLLNIMNLTASSAQFSNCYNSKINPGIANSFASAVFRFGHTLLPGLMKFLQNNASHEEFLQLHRMLFNPFKLYEAEFLEGIMKGALNTSTEKADVYFNKDVTQKLFQQKKGVCGLDLVSLNIQRGRDHGLPPYIEWRQVCNLGKPESFSDLEGEVDQVTLKRLSQIYKSVKDVDLYTGGLAETPVTGGLLGPTFTCLLADQFFRLKVGDRFWYENNKEPQRFTLDQLMEIKKTSLAKIICKNSKIDLSQPYVMKRVGPDNEIGNCDDFVDTDLKFWKQNY